MMSQLKIFTNGCFDVVHRGHIELLQYCATLGEVIVGLNSDSSVKRNKGTLRPINNEQDRKFVLESLKYVSKVIIFNEETPYELIKNIQPDLIIKGGDYIGQSVVGSDICEVRFFEYLAGYSTTGLISRFSKNDWK